MTKDSKIDQKPNSASVEHDVMRNPRPHAIRKCAQWLGYCLKIGWRKDELDFFEKIWWEHHDDNGKLIDRSKSSSA